MVENLTLPKSSYQDASTTRPHSLGVIVKRAAACLVLAYLLACSSGQIWAEQPPSDPTRMAVRKALEEIVAGRRDPTPLVVTYDDLHHLWGGLRLTIRGTGGVGQKVMREEAGQTQKVSRENLTKLAALLVKHAAWEQRVPERMALPDESRASLTIQYGQASVTIWEWHNDLEKNRRIGEIRDFMKEIAWKKPIGSLPTPFLRHKIHTVTSGRITAHFGGEKPPPGALSVPLEYGVQVLWFTFAGDSTAYEFKPGGELFFSDWYFDIFSPVGSYVLLLQDHYGPLHVVAIDRLKDYLTGRAGPGKTVSGHDHPSFEDSTTAQVHKFARWTSDRSFEFSGFCCAFEMRYLYDIPTGKLELRYMKLVSPRKNDPWKSN